MNFPPSRVLISAQLICPQTFFVSIESFCQKNNDTLPSQPLLGRQYGELLDQLIFPSNEKCYFEGSGTIM